MVEGERWGEERRGRDGEDREREERRRKRRGEGESTHGDHSGTGKCQQAHNDTRWVTGTHFPLLCSPLPLLLSLFPFPSQTNLPELHYT